MKYAFHWVGQYWKTYVFILDNNLQKSFYSTSQPISVKPSTNCCVKGIKFVQIHLGPGHLERGDNYKNEKKIGLSN
jgi:hypothetical protein